MFVCVCVLIFITATINITITKIETFLNIGERARECQCNLNTYNKAV